MRLIQRFGRIDRIGSDHDFVYGFNFLPELGIESNLGQPNQDDYPRIVCSEALV